MESNLPPGITQEMIDAEREWLDLPANEDTYGTTKEEAGGVVQDEEPAHQGDIFPQDTQPE